MTKLTFALVPVLLAATAAAAPAGAAEFDPAAAVEWALAALARGEAPVSSRVTAVGADGVVERAATPGEVRAILEGARAALAAGGGSPAGAPPVSVTDVGFGSKAFPLPHAGCAPVTTSLYAITPEDSPPMMKVRLGSGRYLPPGCYGSERALAEVLFDAAPALATCPRCATASAQLWAGAPAGATHVNDFRFAQHRGVGAALDGGPCFTGFCVRGATFYGSAATVELFDAPVEYPIEHVWVS